MLIFLIVVQSWQTYLDSSLAYIGLTRNDIAFRVDYLPRSAYRFAITDELLNSPLHALNFVLSVDEMVWEPSEQDMYSRLVELYNLKTENRKLDFKRKLRHSHQLVTEAFSMTPAELGQVFEDLTLFSPELTASIDEYKQSLDEYDSLTVWLKANATDVGYAKLFSAGAQLLSASLDYADWLAGIDKETLVVEGVAGAVVYYEKCDFGEIVVGDTGTNIYTKDFAVIIDLGGDDEYQCDNEGRIHVWVDKTGNDTYKGGNYSIACGRFGVSILIDEAGDDTYAADAFSLGCGVFGVGVLIDRCGDDEYRGNTFTQGAAGFGIGILKDEDGNDLYGAALYAQGFGSTYGIGVLGDKQGNDMYFILSKYIDEGRYLDHHLSMSQGFAIGFRPDLPGGIGILSERAGNDYYTGDIYAQGTAYWFGIGAIVETAGDDNYLAYQYAQASGVHIAFGLIVDKQGSDNYVAKGVSQGCGHDLALGLLYDIAGDDSYVAYDLSQGAGNANGIGILADESGDDTYSVKKSHNTQGYGNFRREYGSIGVLLDIKGEDVYRTGADGTLWTSGEHGIGTDWE
ncbi:hypothetical protein AMJ87_12955 [candidate division WOR_3 bacterium SM23_60]|uniref:Uncharacterized protein n=1 Tax=candidate division WOR_3 bacterium SM23_60 TaxID=1703780 RepID=A0A0S8G3S0_UNCW3|nr:MAG: hypothetical protein AMJ87_12955 [candidate division WOR_3 bacterium SM23_60]